MASIPPSQFKNPTDIARETFRQLAVQRIAPTPEAYERLYNDIAGVRKEAPAVEAHPADQLMQDFASSLQQSKGELSTFGSRLTRALQANNWDDFNKTLQMVTEHILSKPAPAAAAETPAVALSVSPVTSNQVNPVTPLEDQRLSTTKDALYRVLSLALVSLLHHNQKLSEESDNLGMTVKQAQADSDYQQFSSRVKQLCFQIELQSGDSAELQELLLRLFDLLLTNVHDLLDNDNWLRGQIEVVKNLIAGPIDHRALQEATRSLKDVIYKQGVLKDSIAESQTSVKNMMAAFLDRLNAMAESTGSYQQKIGQYSQQISKATSVNEVSQVLANIMSETREVHDETLRSRDIIVAAQKEVTEAEARIKELENKLAQMSELVREDQLTGSLNRRGMDDIFEREAERSERRSTPLCIALLDLDNFKKLNDTHGHSAGDEALVHLVRIVKQTLRSIDVIARYGGEEFVIIMPETNLDDAAQAMTRVQRELTKHFFVANEQRLFITFSCGVALRKPREAQDETLQRADKAMYEAKKTGKNRVVCAN